MKFGIFNIPYASDYARGERTAKQVIDWDLTLTKWADKYGLDEAYFAEHYTLGAEPSPAPDAMIAAASQITDRIKLGAAAHLLPYHHPVALAHRMLWLDHMTNGRYIAGVAPGAYKSDAQLFATNGQNYPMMAEALDIIEAIWTKEGPFRIEGKYWTVDMPAYDDAIAGPHLKPLQSPTPPMILTGMSESSSTLKQAGRRGYLPMSQAVCARVLRTHWDTFAEGAQESGREAKRSDWRVCRGVLVAKTDEAALELARNSSMYNDWTHNLKAFKSLGIAQLLTDGQIDPEDLTVDWIFENFLFIGSPVTVAQKISALYEGTGGFGTIVSSTHQFDDAAAYEESFKLIGAEVKPALEHLDGGPAASLALAGGQHE